MNRPLKITSHFDGKKIFIPEMEMKITNNFFKNRFHEKNYEKITGPFLNYSLKEAPIKIKFLFKSSLTTNLQEFEARIPETCVTLNSPSEFANLSA